MMMKKEVKTILLIENKYYFYAVFRFSVLLFDARKFICYNGINVYINP